MADNITALLRRAQGGPHSPQSTAPAPPPADGDGVDEYLAYAKLRGVRQAAFMLEFRLADGNFDGLDYGSLRRVRLNPSLGLVLQFGGVTALVKGRTLRPLFEAILVQRCLWIQEMTNPPAEAVRDPDMTLVTSIEIDPE